MSNNNSNLLSEKVRNMNFSATLAMAQKARDLRAKGNDVISLSIGEPDFDTPEHIKEAAKIALDEGCTKYTPVAGLVELRTAISNKLKRDNHLNYNLDQIVVSNGAKQCIANICLALLNKGDEVIIFTPYWVSYFEIVGFAGGTPKPLYADIDKDFKVSVEQLQNAITDKTKLIIFSSPCNPTGSVYTKEELELLSTVIKRHENLFVVSDEIYEYINFESGHASIAAIDGMYEKTITVNGMSKGFAMTGWRLGYLAAPKWIASACSKVQGQFTSGANAFGQMAAAHALDSDLAPTYKMKEEYHNRKLLVKQLLDEIPGIKTNNPKGAFYFFPDISYYFGKSDGEFTVNNADDFAELMLTKAHVAIVTGSAFGDPSCFRLSYAASEKQLRDAISRMKKVLENFS